MDSCFGRLTREPLHADRIKVKGSVFLCYGFVAGGKVLFQGAEVGGNFDCSKGMFKAKPENQVFTDKDRALNADGIEVKGDVFLDDGFSAEGEVRFVGADVGGTFDCSNGKFKAKPEDQVFTGKDRALYADCVKVKGSVFLNDGFTAEGEVGFMGADVGGDFICSNGMFKNTNGKALSADGIKVKGDIFLDDGFIAKGKVRFQGAEVMGNFDCRDGHFLYTDEPLLDQEARIIYSSLLRDCYTNIYNDIRSAKLEKIINTTKYSSPESIHVALRVDGASIKGYVYLKDGFHLDGTAIFSGARIGCDLDCQGGHFTNPDGYAVIADGVVIDGSVFLRNGFAAQGMVRFPNAMVKGDFEISAHAGQAPLIDGILNMEAANIGGILSLESPRWGDRSLISLIHASTKVLGDSPMSWPGKNRVCLTGFTYDSVLSSSSKSVKDWLGWLNLQPYWDFSPQPYEQLANVLRESGKGTEAKKILHDKGLKQHCLLGDQMFLPTFDKLKPMHWHVIFLWLFSHLIKKTIGFGYKSYYSLAWMFAIFMFGSALFGYFHENMTTAKQNVYTSNSSSILPNAPNYVLPGTPFWKVSHQDDLHSGLLLSDDYPHFNAFLYSLDTLVPLVDFNLNQKKYWYPNSNSPWGIWLYLYLIFHTIAGWVLASLLAASLAGVIKK